MSSLMFSPRAPSGGGAVPPAEDPRRSLLKGFDAQRDLVIIEQTPAEVIGTRHVGACDRLFGTSLFQKRRNVLLISLAIAAVLVVGTVVPVLVWMTSLKPITLSSGVFVYTTFHDVRDILVVNASAAHLWPPLRSTEVALLGGGSRASELRQLLELPDGSLLLAQSLSVNSVVFRLPNKCSGEGLSPFIRAWLNHPYGLAHDGRGRLFVTNQDTNSVTLYNYTTGEPIGPSGLFASVANPRGATVDGERALLYVCARDSDAVVEFSTLDGSKQLRQWPVKRPIGLLLWRGHLFVGSSGDNTVVVVDLATSGVVATLTDAQLQHPSGLTVVGDALLLVMSQDARLILAWNIATQPALSFAPLGVWRRDLPFAPEGMLTVNCP